jgi:hypothetical protein
MEYGRLPRAVQVRSYTGCSIVRVSASLKFGAFTARHIAAHPRRRSQAPGFGSAEAYCPARLGPGGAFLFVSGGSVRGLIRRSSGLRPSLGGRISRMGGPQAPVMAPPYRGFD